MRSPVRCCCYEIPLTRSGGTAANRQLAEFQQNAPLAGLAGTGFSAHADPEAEDGRDPAVAAADTSPGGGR